MTILHTIIHYTWALPQTLLGLIIRGFGRDDVTQWQNNPTIYAVKWLKCSAFSLGRFIFIFPGWYSSEDIDDNFILHEFGHSKQSLILGWLYLPVIALPSLMWHWRYYAGKPKKVSYYWFYTERWANKLAGIDLV